MFGYQIELIVTTLCYMMVFVIILIRYLLAYFDRYIP